MGQMFFLPLKRQSKALNVAHSTNPHQWPGLILSLSITVTPDYCRGMLP